MKIGNGTRSWKLTKVYNNKENALKLDNYSIVVLLNQSHGQPYSLSEGFKWNKNINISKRVYEDVLK